VTNVLEFWGVPGYVVDYYSQFDLPSPVLQTNDQGRRAQDASRNHHSVSSTDSDTHLTGRGREELRGTETAPLKEEDGEHNLRRRAPYNEAVDVMEIA
jgi:hypothetical protein